MITPQPPPLPVFIPVQAVAGADVPSQRLPSVAAIETSHIVPMHGSSHRDSRSPNLLWLRRLSKLTDCPLDRIDENRNLICFHPIMAYVAPDDLRHQVRIVFPGVHDTTSLEMCFLA
jgi:hypothetical protein